VILVSEELWRTRFGADPAIVGQTIPFSDMARTVIGVMPRGVMFPNRNTKYWLPWQLGPPAYADDQRGNFMLNGVARLKPGISIDRAAAELNVIARRLAAAFPQTNANTGAVVLTLRDELSPQARRLLWGLVAASVTLLLIACTNLANLLLSRSLVRQRELAVRAALGGGRDRLVRQMFTETMTFAGVGGAIGIALAVAALPFVARLVPTTLPIEESPALDLRMIAAAIAVTFAAAAGVAVIPAFRLGRLLDTGALREGARAGTGRRTERTRAALVVVEIAASIALLVCTGLLLRALLQVQHVAPGFRADGVLAVRLQPSLSRYRDQEQRMQFYGRALSAVRALPGVTDASFISYLPMVVRGGIWPVSVDGKQEDEASAQRASFRQVTPGFFAAMETPLTRGRDFDERDAAASPPVAIVSESFVRHHWPGRDPLGRLVQLGGREWEIVGVAGDIRVRGLSARASRKFIFQRPRGMHTSATSHASLSCEVPFRRRHCPPRFAGPSRKSIRRCRSRTCARCATWSTAKPRRGACR
jgi:putative ABC transport system permease protein